MSRWCLLVALAVTATVSGVGRAADYTWTNVAGGNQFWNVAANWSPVGIPTAITDNATLGSPSASAYTVQLTDTRSINNLTISNASAILNVTGNLAVGASGTLAVNAGTFTLGAGSLTLDGSMTTGAGASASWTGGTLTGGGTLAGTLVASGGASSSPARRCRTAAPWPGPPAPSASRATRPSPP
jgi:hypothetical protein